MPFIGQQPTQGRFIELDSLTASATDDYTLQLNSANFEPESVNNLLVSINGVIQGSSTMSLNGAVLTVGATLSGSDTIDFVRVFGNVGTVSTPTDGSVTANKIGSGAVTTDKLADNSVTSAKITGVSFGKVLQMKPFQTFAMDTGTVIIPNDNSIPQKTEGDEYMSLAFTPVASDSTLYVEVCIHLSHNTTLNDVIAALFIDDASNAVTASIQRGGTQTNCPHSLNFLYTMTSGTTNALTFKVRAGAGGAGTTTFNGRDSGAIFGGVLGSTIKITEIGA